MSWLIILLPVALFAIGAPVFAVLLAGMLAPRNLGSDYAEEFDAVFPRLAEAHGVAFYPFFLDGVAMEPELNQADVVTFCLKNYVLGMFSERFRTKQVGRAAYAGPDGQDLRTAEVSAVEAGVNASMS